MPNVTRPGILPRAVAEAAGTFLLVLFAAGSVMVDERSGGLVTNLGEALSSCLIVMAMVYAIGRISGAHINPAVTLALLLMRRFRLRDAPAYWGAQIGGAVLAAGALRAVFGNVASVGGHRPSGDVAPSLGLEVVLTFSLMFVIMAVVANPARIGKASGLAIGEPRPVVRSGVGRLDLDRPLGLLGGTAAGSDAGCGGIPIPEERPGAGHPAEIGGALTAS